MSVFTKLGVNIAAPTDAAGNPRRPENHDFQVWMTEAERLFYALIAGQGGDIDLPNLLISYTITGGTENAIEAEPNLPVPDAAGEALFSIQIAQDNNGPVTINGKPLLTNSGNQIAAGGLVAGGIYLFLDDGTNFRLVSDQASAAIVAAAEAAQEAAEEARDVAESAAGANLSNVDSVSNAEITNFPEPVGYVRAAGYASAGDGGGALYKRVLTEPSHAGKFQSADGSWWELAETEISLLHMGAGSSTYSGVLCQAAIDIQASRGGGVAVIPRGEFDFSDVDQVVVPSNIIIRFDGGRIIQTGTGNKSAFVFHAGTKSSSIIGQGEIVGPAFSREPSPDTDYQLYPNQNAGVKLLGRSRALVENIIIERGIHIWGWDVSGVYPECTKNCVIAPEISKCGVDGIRYTGDDSSDSRGAYIHDIGPGKDGVAPFLNAYGITATRRQQRTSRLTNGDDPSDAGWAKLGLTATSGSGLDPYNLANALGDLRETAVNEIHSIRWDAGQLPSLAWFAGVIVEADGCDFIRLEIADVSVNTSWVRAHFNIATGEIIQSGAGGNGQILDLGVEDLGGGRYRPWVRGIANVGAVSGTTRWRVTLLQNAGVSLTSGGSFLGDVNSGIKIGGMQLVDNNFFLDYGDPRTVNPPSRNTKIGCRVHNVPSWVGLDTHGGEGIDFSGGVCTRCYIPFNADEGDTSGGTFDSPHRDLVFVNLWADAQDLTDTGAGVVVASKPEAKGSGAKIDKIYLKGYGGPASYGDGRPALGRGAVLISYQNDFTIGDDVICENYKRAAVAVVGNCDGGEIGRVLAINGVQAGGDGVVPVRCEATAGNNPLGVKIYPPRRRGSITALFETIGNAWVQGGYYNSAALPSPPGTQFSQGAQVMVTNGDKPVWWAGSNWRDATGAVVP